MYETHETFTVPFFSNEWQTAKTYISVHVRIWWDDDHMDAEVVHYAVNGRDPIKPGSSITAAALDELVKAMVAQEMDDEALTHIRDTDPAFEGLPLSDDAYMTRAEYQEMVL